MITMTPTLPPGDTSGVFALIALLSDPMAAKKRLEDLLAGEQAAREAAAAAKAAHEEATAKHAEADAAHAAAVKGLEQQAAERAELDAKAADLEAREAVLAKQMADHRNASEAKTTELTTLHEHLSKREAVLKDLEIAASAETARLADLRAELESRFAKLRALAS